MPSARQVPESVFIFGCGYVGLALARELLESDVRVGALTRNSEKAGQLRELGLQEVIEADLQDAAWQGRIRENYRAVVNCVSSAGGGLQGYRKSYVEGQQVIIDWARSQAIENYVYTSSTSVYPQDTGGWVDELADTSDAPPTGQVLLESEALLVNAGFPAHCILRLAGIYGPGRHYLLNQLKEGAGEIPGSGDYALNMIHRDDIVRAIYAALAAGSAGGSGIYNIADDEPKTKAEVLAWLAGQLRLPEPVFNPNKVSERLKRRGGRMPHRRVSNAKARAGLDWQPQYPSFREGYADLLAID